jgi:Putative MetA-pathway of phenol degradation
MKRHVSKENMARYERLFLVALSLAASIAVSPAAHARGLAGVFRQELAGLELEPVGDALANTVAYTYPVASASSSVTYAFNPATESFERQTRVLGPIIGERAETIGKGQMDASFSYSYVNITNINGDDLGHLENKASIGGNVVSFPVPGGLTLADGRFTNYLPLRVLTDLGVTAHIMTPSFTYGVTPGFDVNLTIPIIVTTLSARANVTVPDPRLPQFALQSGDPNAQQRVVAASSDSGGIGDILLRAKYVLLREAPVDLAAGLGISFPSGSVEDFHGSGNYRVQPSLILSRVLFERFEPLLNVGVDINADSIDRSIVRWAVGTTAQLVGQLNAALVFLGRHELSEQTTPLATPFFLQIERNDIYDASIGLRYLFLDSGVISVNAIVPLNDAGLRAEVIPTVQVEYAFSAPW